MPEQPEGSKYRPVPRIEREQLVAAYLVGWKVDKDAFAPKFPFLDKCDSTGGWASAHTDALSSHKT